MHSYHDLNGDVGGYIKKDKLWWYSSLRDQDVQSLLPNFPVKPFETHLQNITGKGTYSINPNNKLVAFAQWGLKQQPNRLDTFLIGATAAIHNSADSTWNQSYWAHTYKVGWDDVVNDKMFFEVHGGQFHYLWPNTRETQAPAYQDLTTNIVSGGNQDGWFRDITAQPDPRLAQLLQGRLGRQSQLQGRRRVLQRALRRPPRPGRPRPGAERRADGAQKRQSIGSPPVPDAVRVAERSVDHRAVRVGRLASELALDDDAGPGVRPVSIVPSGPDRPAGRSVQSRRR